MRTSRPSTMQQLWDYFTLPHPEVKGNLERERARLAAGLSLFLGIITLLIALLALPQGESIFDPDVIGSVLIFGIAYGASRSRYPAVSGMVLTAGFGALLFGILAFSDEIAPESHPETMYFLLLPITISSLLLAPALTSIVTGILLTALIVFSLFSPLGFAEFFTAIVVNTFVSAISVALSLVRSRDVTSLEAQTRELEKAGADLQTSIQARTRDLQVAANVSRQVISVLELDDLLQRLTEVMKESFSLYHTQVYLLDVEKKLLVLGAGAGDIGRRMKAAGHSIPLSVSSIVATSARTRQPVIVQNTQQAHDYLPNPLLPETRAEMAMPLLLGDEVIGVLDLQSAQAGRFFDEHITVMEVLAGQVAVAVQNARAFTQVRRAQEETQSALNELAVRNRLSAGSARIANVLLNLGLDGIDEGLGILGNLLNASRVYVMEYHNEGEAYYANKRNEWVAEGIVATKHILPARIRVDEAVPNWLDSFQHNRPNRSTLDTALEPELTVMKTEGIQSIISFPLFVENHLYGTLNIEDALTQRIWTTPEAEVIESAAVSFAYTITGARLLKQTQDALRQVEALYTIGQQFTTLGEPETLLRAFAAPVLESGASGAILLYTQEDRTGKPSHFEVMASASNTPTLLTNIGADERIPLLPTGVIGSILRNPFTIRSISDLANDKDLPENLSRILQAQGFRSTTLVPLAPVGQEWVATVVFGWPETNGLTADQHQLYTLLAPQLATVLQNQQLLIRTQEAASDLDRAFNLPSEMLGSTTLDGRLNTLNVAWETLLGYSRNDLLGKPFIDFVHPDDVAHTQAESNRVVQRQANTTSFSNRYRSRDGSYRWIDWTATLDRDRDLIYFAARDITERKQVEERQEVANAVAQALAQILDPQELIQTTVERLGEAFGYYYAHIYVLDEETSNLVVAYGLGEAGRVLSERGHAIPLNAERSLVAAAASTLRPQADNNVRSNPAFLPNPLLPRTRSEVAIPLVAGNRLLGVLDVQHDKTNHFDSSEIATLNIVSQQLAVTLSNAALFEETSTSEEFLRTILNLSPDWIWAKDLEGRFTVANATFAEQAIGSTPEYIVGRTDYDFFPVELIEGNPERGIVGFKADDQKVILTGQMVENPYDIVKFQDGSEHILDTKKFPLRDPQGNVMGTLGIGRDVTEREMARRREQLANEIGQQLSGLLDTEQLLATTITRLAEAFNYYHAHIYLFDEQNSALVVRAGLGTAGRILVEQRHTISLAAQRSMVATAGREMEPVVANNVLSSPTHLPNPLLPLTRSEVAIPIVQGRRLLGVLDVQHNVIDHFNQAEILTLETIATQLAVALSNAILFAETEQALAVTEALYAGSEAITNAHSVHDALEALVQSTSLLHMDRATIQLYEKPWQEGDALPLSAFVSAAWSRPDQETEPPSRAHYDLAQWPLAGTFFRRDMTVYQDARDDQMLSDEERSFLLNEVGIRGLVVVPLWSGNNLIGLLGSTSAQPLRLATDDIRQINVLAEQTTTVLQNIRLLEEAQTRARQIETVAQVGISATTILDRVKLLEEVVELTKRSFGLYHAHIYVLDRAGATLVLEAGAGEPGRIMKASGHSIPYLAERSIVARAARTRQPIIVDDVTEAPTFLPNPLLPNTRSEIALPMVVGNTLIGVLDLQADEPNRFRTADVEVLTTLALQIAVALQNAIQYERSELRARELATVAQVSITAATTLDSDDLLRQVVELTKERFRLYHVHIYLLDAANQFLVLEAGAGDAGRIMKESGHRIDVDAERSIVARVARSREAVIVDDVLIEPFFLPNPLLPDTRSELAIPMIVGNRVIGVFDVQSELPARFTLEDVQIKATLAEQVAVALQNARQYELTQAALSLTATLYETSRALLTASTPEELLDAIATPVLQANPSGATLLFVSLDANNDITELEVIAASRTDGLISLPVGTKLKPSEMPFPLGYTTAQAIADIDHPQYQLSDVMRKEMHAFGTQAFVSVPLVAGRRTIGYVNFTWPEPHEFREEERQLFETVAPQMAALIENQRLSRETAEAALLLRSLIDATTDWIWVKGRDYKYLIANRKFAQDLGVDDPLTMVGKDEYEVFNLERKLVEGQQDDERGGYRGDFGRVVEYGEVIDVQDVVPFADKSEHIMETRKLPLRDSAGNIIGMLSVARDVTERETSRRRQQAAYELAQQLSSSLQPIPLLNDTVERVAQTFDYYHTHIYLYDPEHDLLVVRAGLGQAGGILVQRQHSIARSADRSLVARAARALEPVIVNNVRESPDHLPNPLLPHTRSEVAVPLVLGDRLVGVLDVQHTQANHFDEDEVRTLLIIANQLAVALSNAQLYQEQIETAEKLRDLDQLKSEFLANMSHELRTPLNSIIGYSELLIDELEPELDEMSVEDLKAIHASGHHLLAIINDILDLAKIEANRMEINRTDVDVPSFIPQLVDMTRVLLKDKPQVALHIDVPDEMPPLSADPVRLRQILWNLLSNAIKFTEHGEVRLSCWLEDDWLLVSVEDTGVGIPTHQHHMIFDQFRQADGSATRKAGGTGLGLSITRQLAHLHGGNLWLEKSEPGSGSEFRLKLPLIPPEILPQPIDSSSPGQTNGNTGGNGSRSGTVTPAETSGKASGD